MASSIIAVAPGAWVQVTSTDKEGSIFHKSGGKVIYIEAIAAPPTVVEPIATMEVTEPGQGFGYFGIAATDNLYALAVSENAEIVKAPKGV